jgi:hypothetical protein
MGNPDEPYIRKIVESSSGLHGNVHVPTRAVEQLPQSLRLAIANWVFLISSMMVSGSTNCGIA